MFFNIIFLLKYLEETKRVYNFALAFEKQRLQRQTKKLKRKDAES